MFRKGFGIFLIFLCNAYWFSLQAQNPVLDGLKAVVDSFEQQRGFEKDTSYIKTLNKLAYNFYSYNPDSTHFYGKKAMSLSQSIGYLRGAAEGLRQQGISFAVRDDYPNALENYFACLQIFEQLKDTKGIGDVFNNIGIVYHNQTDYEKALEYYQKSLAIREQLNDLSGVNRSLNNIGNIYESMDDFTQALAYHERSLAIKIQLNDEWGISVSYNNIGNLHERKKEYEKAIEFYKKSMAIKEKMQDFQGTSVNLNNIGNLYRMSGNFTQSLVYNRQALELAQSIKAKSSIKEALLSLSLTYKDQKNFEKALDYFEQFKLYSDSIISESADKQISELELERKDLENKRLEALGIIQEEEKEMQQIIIFSGLIGLLGTLVFAALIYRNQQKLKVANLDLAEVNEEVLQKNEEINQQKEELSQTLDVVNEQKLVIEQANANIIASINYANRIQKAVLPSNSRLEVFFKQFFVLYQPKDIVSGDFYWLSEVQRKTNDESTSDILILAVADCTGHGVSGAFMTLIANTLLNQIVNENHISDPSTILTELDKRLSQTLQQSEDTQHLNDGMDIVVVAWDKAQSLLTLSSAKRPVLYFQKDVLHEIKGSKFPIGGSNYFREKIFDTAQIVMKDKTQLYLFTDGYIDQFGGKNDKKLMASNFKKQLESIHSQGFNEQKIALETHFENWKGNKKQTDDVLVMGICFG